MDNATTKTIDGHTYEIKPHPAQEGWPLGAEILSLGAEPLARAIEAWTKADGALAGLDGEGENADTKKEALAELLKDVDWSSIGGDISKSLVTLARNPELMDKMFLYTFRDKAHLAHPQAFSNAFTANYVEMGKALKAIAEVNGFLPFSS